MIKQAFKAKYEARLKQLKTEFETKFKKNEQTWRQRMDCHKQALAKEQGKNREFAEVIEEMAKRMSALERKNKEMHSLVVKSNSVNSQL